MFQEKFGVESLKLVYGFPQAFFISKEAPTAEWDMRKRDIVQNWM